MVRLIIHPGEHLADELKALGMSANELAKELGVPTNRLTEIIRGKRGISGDTALRLGRWFGTGPDIWMNLQKKLRTAAGGAGNRRCPAKNPSASPGRQDKERFAAVARLLAVPTQTKPQSTGYFGTGLACPPQP